MSRSLPRVLRAPRRLLPGAAGILALLLVAFVVPSKPLEDTTGGLFAGGDDTAAEGSDGGTGSGGTTGDTTTPTDGSGAPIGGAGNESTGGLGGPSGPSGSVKPPTAATANRNTYQGVTDKEIVVVFGYQRESCGQDISAFAGRVNPNPDPQKSINTAISYFNKRAGQLFGGDLPPQLRTQLGSAGFYGRNLKPVLVQDRGDACAEQSRADAQQAAEKHKPFAAIGGSNEWDDEMTRRKIMRVSGKPALDNYFTSRRPFMWGPITGMSATNQFLSGYVAALTKSPTINTGSVGTAGKQRVFGIYHLDDKETKAVVDDLVARLAKRGVKVARVIGYEPNVGTIGSQTTNAVLQFKAAGVNSLIMAMDPIAALFLTQSADSQDWFPEWITSTIGLMDNAAGPRSFMTASQAKNAFGISVFFPSKPLREEQQEPYLAWKAERPNEEPPSDFAGWYNSLKLIARGVALAGPNLTPQNFEAGYNAYCNPCSRTDPLMPLIGYGPGDFTAVDDAHKQRYDPKAPDYTAPKSQWQNGQPPSGAYVYEDGGKRYTSFE